ncbi:MAG: M14 family metallopeptidase [Oscillospiraceae bacterium]|nr:M14 family metallopeptidase [Oscillospiraceae bacterium]
MIEVFGKKCEKGQKLFFSVDGPQYANRATMQIPVIVLCGAEDGPTFWINGTVHGDEINGSYAAWKLARELNPSDVRGNVIVTPLANGAAFVEQCKVSSIDGLDMDTQFPGVSDGMAAQIMAKIIYDEVKKHASFLVNFHTISHLYDAQPYTVSKIVPGADAEVNKKALELALVFGVKANCVVDLSNAAGELPGVTSGALDITCIRDGVPAFMGEIGHGGVADPEMMAVARQGLLNIMISQGMIDGEIQRVDTQYRITKRKFVRSAIGGLIEMDVKPGDIVKNNTEIAHFHFYDDNLIPFKVEQDSYIIATRVCPAFNSGDRVAFLGLEWEKI